MESKPELNAPITTFRGVGAGSGGSHQELVFSDSVVVVVTTWVIQSFHLTAS